MGKPATGQVLAGNLVAVFSFQNTEHKNRSIYALLCMIAAVMGNPSPYGLQIDIRHAEINLFPCVFQ